MRDTRIVGGNRGFKDGRKKAPNFERLRSNRRDLTTKFAEWRISSCLEQLRRAGAGGLVLDTEQSRLWASVYASSTAGVFGGDTAQAYNSEYLWP